MVQKVQKWNVGHGIGMLGFVLINYEGPARTETLSCKEVVALLAFVQSLSSKIWYYCVRGEECKLSALVKSNHVTLIRRSHSTRNACISVLC
jgi:hypothetical protein